MENNKGSISILIAMLNNEKSTKYVINCKNTLVILMHTNQMIHPSFTDDLKYCFPDKPQQLDKALKIYQEIINFLQ